ncbi:MAG: DoxX family protein [Bacteroidales bacterium]
MKIAGIVSKYIVALVFIFSGFVKCVDPLGTAYKFEDYFIALGWDFFLPFSQTLSIIMCGTELLVGLMLLLNLRVVWASWLALLLMLVFTPLTLWLALTDKVQDCGCFGDAVKMTNWETFLKNIVLDVFLVILFIRRKTFANLIRFQWQFPAAVATALLVLGFEWYNLTHLPMIDFLPYRTGQNILEGMTVPEDAPQDEFKITLTYRKGDLVKDFTLDDYPGNDTSWVWVDTKSLLVKKGYVPPIHDFSIRRVMDYEEDITYEVLEDPGFSFLVISHNLRKASTRHFDRINELARFADGQGHRFIMLSGSSQEENESFKRLVGAGFEFYNTDPTTLKTVIRNNPGLVLLKGGTIIGKWPHRNIPSPEKLLSRFPEIR